MSCSGEAPAAAAEHPWHVSASYGLVWSGLSFGNGVDADLFQRAVVASLSRRLGERFTVLGSAGATLGGSLDFTPGNQAELLPSWVLAAGLTWQILNGAKGLPFITLSGVLSASSARTTNASTSESARYTSIDVKAIGIVGYTFFGRLSPYVGASLFGGPIFWTINGSSVVGTDRSHFQVLAGASVAIPFGLDLFVEGSPLGERSVSAGLGLAF
jgi:hypothetical protein